MDDHDEDKRTEQNLNVRSDKFEVEDCARRIVGLPLKLTTDRHEASRGLSATAELLVIARQHSNADARLLTRDIAILSVRPSVRSSVCHVPVYSNGFHLTYRHTFVSIIMAAQSLFFNTKQSDRSKGYCKCFCPLKSIRREKPSLMAATSTSGVPHVSSPVKHLPLKKLLKIYCLCAVLTRDMLR